MTYRHIIGIDASVTATAIADDNGVQVYGGKDPKLGDVRLSRIYDGICDHLRRVDSATTLVVMEDLPMHAKAAGVTGMAQGVVRLALARHQTRPVLVAAATLKAYATGSGSASKPDMRVELYKRTGLDLPDDNKVDAWWLRQAGLDIVAHPDAITLPKHHRSRLGKVAWPNGVGL